MTQRSYQTPKIYLDSCDQESYQILKSIQLSIDLWKYQISQIYLENFHFLKVIRHLKSFYLMKVIRQLTSIFVTHKIMIKIFTYYICKIQLGSISIKEVIVTIYFQTIHERYIQRIFICKSYFDKFIYSLIITIEITIGKCML